MKREIRIFKSLEEQEQYFLEYFANLSYSERLQALAHLQKMNSNNITDEPQKKITVHKHFVYGH